MFHQDPSFPVCLQESPIHLIIKELLSFIMSRIFSTYAEAMDGYIVSRCHHCQEYIHSHITDCFGCKDCDMEVDRDAIDDKDDTQFLRAHPNFWTRGLLGKAKRICVTRQTVTSGYKRYRAKQDNFKAGQAKHHHGTN